MAQISKRPVKRVKIKGFKAFRKKQGEPKDAANTVVKPVSASAADIEEVIEETSTVEVPVTEEETGIAETTESVNETEPIEETPKKKRGKKTNKKQEE
jgi:hypothetical protein